MASLSISTQEFPNNSSELPSANVTVAVSSRRLPPPCWSHEETIALIDAYRDKWYSLRRGNLRANHWQEVADDIAVRCPVDLPKTAVQCRHKMEKLRKRYRAEIQRAAPYGGIRSHRYCSAWVHFKRMDTMERGPDAVSSDEDVDENVVANYHQNNVKNIGNLYGNSVSAANFHGGVSNGGGGGVRIRIPGFPGTAAPPMAKPYSRVENCGVENPNYGFVKKADLGKRVVGEEKRKGDPMEEMVEAIKVLGDGFVRMERMKMDMARELEQMRMEMEMKRTQMILESQQRIVDAFAHALSEDRRKKAKRMPTPEC